MTKHNKYYYEKGRNGWTPTTTWQDEVVEDKDNKWSGGKINPKMFLTKKEIEFMKKTKYNFNWQLEKLTEKIVNLLKEKNAA
jgi:hypothetical protein